jgi:hypothetical protein
MTPAAASAYIRLRTRTNTTTFTNADMLILWNVVKNDLCQRALETDEDIFLVPTYMDLVASTTQREYPLHSNILSRIKRVEAALDGSNYIKLESFDLSDHDKPVTGEANITSRFGNAEGEAFYDIMRKAIWIYSGTITAGTDTLRIWVNTYPADVSDMASATDMSVDPSTTTHGVPKALHKVISDGVIIEWKGSREKPIPLSDHELLHERHIEKAFQTLKKASYDTEVQGDLPDNDEMQGDDGSDY